MDNLSKQNKNLIVKTGVLLTPHIDRVIQKLDYYFAHFGMIRHVTSGYRLKMEQMAIIIKAAERYNIPVLFMELDSDKKLPDGHFVWQDTWSQLLELGYIVNPPARAMVIRDYIVNGLNHRGTIIEPSSHFNGNAFDIGGASGVQSSEEAQTIKDELEVIKFAQLKEPDIGIMGVVVERNNNCLHVNTVKI